MEKRRMKVLQTLITNAGWGIIFGLFGYVVMFFFNIILTRVYSVQDVGFYSLSQTFLNICFVIAVLGLTGGIGRYLPIYEEKKKEGVLKGYLRFVLILPLFNAVLLSAVIFLFAPSINSFFNLPPEFTIFLKFVALALPLRTINKVLTSIFFAKKKMLYAHLSWDVVGQLTLLSILIISALFNWSIKMVVLGIVLASAFSLITNVWFARKLSFTKTKKIITKKKEWLLFSFPLFFTGFFAFLIGWSDNLVIAKLLTPIDLGIYAVTFSFASFLGFFSTPIRRIFLPLASENKARKEKNMVSTLFKYASSWTFGLTLPVYLLFLLYARQILELLYGKVYSRGFAPLMILGGGYLFMALLNSANDIIIIDKKTSFIFRVNFCVAIYNIFANIVLITRWGITGAAIATSSAFILRSIIFFFKARTSSKISPDWEYLVKFSLAGVFSLLFSSWVMHFHIALFLRLAISGVTYLSLYILFLRLLKTFREEDLLIILTLEKKTGFSLSFLRRLIISSGREK